VDEHPEFTSKVKVCFSGKVHHTYINLTKELGMEDIFIFKGYLDYRRNIGFLNSASVLLLLTTHDAPDAVPGKLYEYFALKKPVLAVTEGGATRDLMLSQNAGKVVHPGDKDRIKDAVWSLYRDFCRGRQASPSIPPEKFNRRHQAGELADVFSQLVD
jgi:glycosyltransferase involved in cell wall biosynthesis